MAAELSNLTEHEQTWWGIQNCRRCNPMSLRTSPRPPAFLPQCLDCDGTGWTEHASLSREPFSKIVPGLWIGGHDYVVDSGTGPTISSVSPKSMFDTVISLYVRPGLEPDGGVEHVVARISDSLTVSDQDLSSIAKAAVLAEQRILEGNTVLTRCQAGLNRSSLVAGLAMRLLGYEGKDAVQLIRHKRSPWALCNSVFAGLIEEVSVPHLRILSS